MSTMAEARSANAATIVACIGDQLTMSADTPYNIDGGANDLWPGVLQALLGDTYKVGNDVVTNGNTVAPAENCVTTSSKTGPPSIVVIAPFVEHEPTGTALPAWQADYQTVVNDYLALTPAPTVYVMTPPPGTFTYQSAAENTFAVSVVEPAVLAVQQGTAGVKLIDLFHDSALAAAGGGDGHFSLAESADVAELAFEAITGKAPSDAGSSGSVDASASSGSASGAGSGVETSGAAASGGSGAPSGSGAVAGSGAGGSGGTPGSGETGSGSEGSGASSSGGGGGGSGSAESGTSAEASGSSNGEKPPVQNTSGCTLSPGTGGTTGATMALLGIAAVFSRRRKSPRSRRRSRHM